MIFEVGGFDGPRIVSLGFLLLSSVLIVNDSFSTIDSCLCMGSISTRRPYGGYERSLRFVHSTL